MYQPFNESAEQAVLATILTSPETFIEVMDLITADDFYIYQNKVIYQAIVDVDAKRKPIDPSVIISHLQEEGKLEEVGGLAYLAEIAMNAMSTRFVKEYAGYIKNKSRERALLNITRAMITEIQDGDGDTDTRINNAMSMMVGADDAGESERDTLSFLKETVLRFEARDSGKGKITGLKTQYRSIDKRFHGLQPGQLMIIAARPAMGKTTWALNLCLNALFQEPHGSVLFFSLEMAGSELTDKMTCALGRLNYESFRAGFHGKTQATDDDYSRLNYAISKLKTANGLVIDDRASLTIQQIRAKAIKTKRRHGVLKAIFIDYLTLIKTPGKDSRTNEVGAVSRALKALSKEMECPVICLAQLSRKCEERTDKRPMMSDLRDSGEIEQDADIICMLYRDEIYNEETLNKGIAEIITVKNRAGTTGTDYLCANLSQSRFDDLPDDYELKKPEVQQKRRRL